MAVAAPTPHPGEPLQSARGCQQHRWGLVCMTQWLDLQKPLTFGAAERPDGGRHPRLPRGVDSFHSSHGALAPSATRAAEPALSDVTINTSRWMEGKGEPWCQWDVCVRRTPPATRTPPAPEQVQRGPVCMCAHGRTRKPTGSQTHACTRAHPQACPLARLLMRVPCPFTPTTPPSR